mgnify:FL=1
MSIEMLTPKASNARKRALVVDNDSDIRGMHVAWMSQGGFDCLEANDAESASKLLEHESIDLLVTDLDMPGVGGLELLRRIKSTHPDIAVVVLTGVAETRTAIQAFTSGASDYLVKPVGREELMLQLYRVLESRELQIQRRHYLKQLEAQVLEQSRGVRQAQEDTVQRLVTASKFRDTETGAHIKRKRTT